MLIVLCLGSLGPLVGSDSLLHFGTSYGTFHVASVTQLLRVLQRYVSLLV